MATELSPQHDETLPERADIAPDSDPLAALAAHLEDHVNEDDSNGLVLAYRDIAKERGVSQTVVEEHGRLLETVPSDLVVDTYSHVPTAFGGAVLNFGNAIKKSLPGVALSGVAEAGIELATVPIPPKPLHIPLPGSADHASAASQSLRVVLVDHLGLNGLPISNEAMLQLRSNAAGLGPWWRARSLSLSGCGLGFAHLTTLASPKAQPLVCNLCRLDLSNNPELGMVSDSERFSAPDIAYLYYLWRHAPLEYVDLSHTALEPAVLAAILHMLTTYELPSQSGGIGRMVHDGARLTLQVLKIGPFSEQDMGYGDRGQNPDQLDQFGYAHPKLAAELRVLVSPAGPPQLRVLELYGAGIVERDELGGLWTETQQRRGHSTVQAAIVRPGVVRLAAGDAACRDTLPVEHVPDQHTVPPPAPITPSCPPEDLDEHIIMPSSGLGDVELTEQEGGLDDWEPSGLYHKPTHGTNYDGDDTIATMLHQVTLTKRRKLGGSGGRISGQTGGQLQRRRRKPSNSQRARSSRPRVARKSNGTVRMYRGGLVEDELPVGGAEIDLVSDDDYCDDDDYFDDNNNDDDDDDDDDHFYPVEGADEDDDDEQDDEEDVARSPHPPPGIGNPISNSAHAIEWLNNSQYEEEGDQGLRNDIQATRVTPVELETKRPGESKEPEPFRLRDGALDHDSRLGRKYRSDAKRFVKKIPDAADRKAASRAFKMWDDFAENAWDRHRWDRPSRTQNDLPATLNQLNLLYDILEKYGMSVGMPFPARVAGAGAHAFGNTSVPGQLDPVDPVDQGEDEATTSIPNSPLPAPVLPSATHLPVEESQPLEVDGAMMVGEKSRAEDRTVRRTILSDSSSLSEEARQVEGGETVDGVGTASGKKESAAARELARLAAWGWDSRKEQHPPNKDKYGSVDGKRTRRQRFHASQLELNDDVLALLDAEDDFQTNLRTKSPPRDSNKRRPHKKTTDNNNEEDEEDDDVPLVRRMAFGDLMQRLGGEKDDEEMETDREAETDGDVFQAVPMLNRVEESTMSGGTADLAARALLGSLYLSGQADKDGGGVHNIHTHGVVLDSEADE